MERRDFLKTIAVSVGASLVAATPAPSHAKTSTSKRKSAIVAGAGITGLCCAYELMRHGVDVTVLEASDRTGGHVFTGRDGLSEGSYADYGADHVTVPGYEQFMHFVKEFGLALVPYPNAEGSPLPANNGQLTMIDGKFYDDAMLRNPNILAKFGFDSREVAFLRHHGWYDLPTLYIGDLIDGFKNASQPFGNGCDELDEIDMATLYARRGASAFAQKHLGGERENALFCVWRFAVMKARGIPLSEGETFHLKGGNEAMPNAFAARLGGRIWLNHQVTSISQDADGVSATYTTRGPGTPQTLRADYLVNCVSMPVFSRIKVQPALSAEKQYLVDNLVFSSHPFFVFEAETKFWLEDGYKRLGMSFEDPEISSIWELPKTNASGRVLLKAFGKGGRSPEQVLAAFRRVYPGKRDTIVHGLTKDWTRDKFAPTCEMEAVRPGILRQFWPEILRPDGRLYFAGTYADALSRGMESCVRSAVRVAKEIADV